MAVVYKTRSKKVIASGSVSVGYGNFAVPGMLKNKHLQLNMKTPDEKYLTLYLSSHEVKKLMRDCEQYMKHEDIPQ